MGEAIVFLTGRQRASITERENRGRNQQGRRNAAPPLPPVKVGIGEAMGDKGDGNKVEATNTNTRPPLLQQLSIINIGLPFDGL